MQTVPAANDQTVVAELPVDPSGDAEPAEGAPVEAAPVEAASGRVAPDTVAELADAVPPIVDAFPAAIAKAGAGSPIAPETGPVLLAGPAAGAIGPAAPAARTATAAPAGAAAASATGAPVAPAAQVAPVLVALGRGPAGSQRLTLDLHPAELGRVQIRLDRSKSGEATVHISAERPETLLLLRHDQPQLHRALDQAGIPAAGRQVFLDTAGEQAMPRRHDFTASGNSSGNGNDTGGFGKGSGGAASPGGGRGDGAPKPPRPAAWARTGFDITA